jgi:hypothetical protein
VIGGAKGIVRFWRRHGTRTFEQPRVAGGMLPSCDISGGSEVWPEKNALLQKRVTNASFPDNSAARLAAPHRVEG